MLCKNCGEPCPATYCSVTCKLAYKTAHKRTQTFVCAECGGELHNRRGVYCSDACNRTAEASRLTRLVQGLLDKGLSVAEIARKLKAWPKKIEEIISKTQGKEEGPDATVIEAYPISLPTVTIQARPFTREDELNAKMFRACLAGYERAKKNQ
jgi:hypothetical protein